MAETQRGSGRLSRLATGSRLDRGDTPKIADLCKGVVVNCDAMAAADPRARHQPRRDNPRRL